MIGYVVAGLMIGALARLIMPGKQHLGIVMTLLLGWRARSSAASPPSCLALAISGS